MEKSSPVGSSGLAHGPQGRERNLHSRCRVGITVSGARPSPCAARRGAASCPRATCGHPSYQEDLCRGGSFTCVPSGLSGLSGLGVLLAGRFWAAFGRQLTGAREGAEVIQAADGGASGPRLVAPAETAQGSQESGAGSEVATWPRGRPPRDGD